MASLSCLSSGGSLGFGFSDLLGLLFYLFGLFFSSFGLLSGGGGLIPSTFSSSSSFFCGSSLCLFGLFSGSSLVPSGSLSGGGFSLSGGLSFSGSLLFASGSLLFASGSFTSSSLSLGGGSASSSSSSNRDEDTCTKSVFGIDQASQSKLTPLGLSGDFLVQVQCDLILFRFKLDLAESLRDDKGASLRAESANLGGGNVFSIEARSRSVEDVVDLGKSKAFTLGNAERDRVGGCFEELKACRGDTVGSSVLGHCDFVGHIVLELEFEFADSLRGIISLCEDALIHQRGLPKG